MKESYWNKLVNIVSWVLQGCVLGPLLFLLYTSQLLSVLENKLIGYDDGFTLIYVVTSPGFNVAESLNLDLGKVIEWCDFWGMKLNVRQTKTMMVSSSSTNTMLLQSSPLTICRTVLKESDDLDIWESHLIPK